MIGLLASDLVTRKLFGRGANRPPGRRPAPDRVLLAPRPGTVPSSRPPVRIFVGTEPGQYRSERVFVWSIERVRDPGRAYEIYLMRDLTGFDRRRWLTGFTNYRFAIPHFAGEQGRAIYNDVDQIYLADPAGLFDIDMGSHGFLALSTRDTSVMVMDCARMGSVWRVDEARRERRKPLEAKAAAIAGLWGPLPREWHARDEEYQAGMSRVLHFTTIHTQPWQPFPEHFVYQPNPVGHVWLEMEREADRAGFHVFTRTRPSPRYLALRDGLGAQDRGPAPTAGRADEYVNEMLRAAAAGTVLRCGLRGRHAGTPDLSVAADDTSAQYIDLADLGEPSRLPPRQWDAVVCDGGLERIPVEDAAWVVDTLFEHAGRVLAVAVVDGHAKRPREGDEQTPPRGEPWWTELFTRVSCRYPLVRWRLIVWADEKAHRPLCVREGGRRPDGRAPAIWVLADHKLGHTTQSVGLATALGWPYEVKQLRFNRLERRNNRRLGAQLLSLDRQGSAPLQPPWPDLVIATGRRTVPVARWIGAQSNGRTRLVQLGRRGADRADAFDLSVSCAHYGLPLHPRRIETVAPLTGIDDARLQAAAERWRDLFAGLPHPHVALLVGGSSAVHRLDADTASRLVAEAAAFARAAAGSLYIVTSPRTDAAATAAMRAEVGEAVRLYEWRPRDPENPYLGCLAIADVLVVTGDSESMLAEAAATGKPLYIYSVPARPPGRKRRLRAWIVRQALARPRKDKGTVRPQQGLEYLCARLIERGLVRPPRNVEELHRQLIAAGYAYPFGTALDCRPHVPLRELDRVAEHARALLGHYSPAAR